MASWWQKTLDTAAGLAGFAGGTYSLLTRRPQPQKSGTLQLQGLHEAVEIITDRYGIPHIYAENEDDLYFSQGYIHAQERLWQMEINRRIGAGRLCEIFGSLTLEVDRFSRRLGMHRSAVQDVAKLSTHDTRVLDAYARGVNSFIEHNANKLPVEFTILGFQPEPWQAIHTLQWGKMMGWNLGGNWETEIVRALLVAKLGPERAAKLEAGYDPDHPLIIPPGISYGGINADLLEQYHQLKELSGFGMLGASNNWVVDGTMTESGYPILCNDPHLGLAAPSIWFECHMVAGDIDVVGASFPGSPGVVIGHNQYIAWGVTNAISDVQDMYIEKFNPENPNQYEFMDKWEEAQVVREAIQVKGQDDPVIEEVRVTRHGPVLTTMSNPNGKTDEADGASQSSELQLALRWVGLEQSNILSSIQKLNRASNWTEFLDAMRDWDVPAQNFVYGDREGNIGYIMAGAIPVRARGQALLPSPGWSGEYEWTGMIPFEELPQTFNPEQHFIVTANNRVINDDYPYYITHEWLNGYRAQRIRDLISEETALTTTDMAYIQADVLSLPAQEIVPHMLTISPATPLEEAAIEILQTWDKKLAKDSIGASIYTTFLRKLERIVFNTLLGDDDSLLMRYLGMGTTALSQENGYISRSKPLIIRLLKAHDDAWFEQTIIPNGPTSWDEALAAAFSAAIEDLRDRLGPNILRWQYGLIHTFTFRHALGTVKALTPFFNRGPYPYGGDIDTVCMGATVPTKPEQVVTVPSYRQIVDLGDLPASLSGHGPGQSGLPASSHYDDFVQMWLDVQHHPMLYDHSQITANAEGTLRLTPR